MEKCAVALEEDLARLVAVEEECNNLVEKHLVLFEYCGRHGSLLNGSHVRHYRGPPSVCSIEYLIKSTERTSSQSLELTHAPHSCAKASMTRSSSTSSASTSNSTCVRQPQFRPQLPQSRTQTPTNSSAIQLNSSRKRARHSPNLSSTTRPTSSECKARSTTRRKADSQLRLATLLRRSPT